MNLTLDKNRIFSNSEGRAMEIIAASALVPGIGRIWAARSRRGLMTIVLRDGRGALVAQLPAGARISYDASAFRRLFAEAGRLAAGKRPRFSGAIDIRGTAFQKRVWRAIASIPWGETRSYAWLAKKIGRPRAVRAAASACGANPLPLVIPCHRVIASNGSLGGFSGGLALKKRLLDMERR